MRKAFYFIALLLVISCSKEDEVIPAEEEREEDREEETRGYFDYTPSNIIPSSKETEFTIKLRTNRTWKLRSKPDWLTVSSESGDGDTDLIIKVFENTDLNSRQGYVIFQAAGKSHLLDVEQKSFPLELVDYTGKNGLIKMSEPFFLRFNRPITLNSLKNSDSTYFILLNRNELEYFDDQHGVKVNLKGPLGMEDTYTFRVTDNEDNVLTGTVDLEFYSQKLSIPSAMKKMVWETENIIWVLTQSPMLVKKPAYVLKFKETDGQFEEVLRFKVDLTSSGDFFINPYNDLIYLPDYEDAEIEVYTKTGRLVKKIPVLPVNSDHPEFPHINPVSIGFTSSGKGIVTLAGKEISNFNWRFIDSTNGDVLTEPDMDHSQYYLPFQQYVLNQDHSKLYVLPDRSTVINIFERTQTLGDFEIHNLYPSGADAAMLTQNKVNSKLFVSGLYNQQIITPDLSYLSKQSFFKYLIGDFCYDPNLQNHIYALSPNVKELMLLDYDNQETVFKHRMDKRFSLTDRSGIITTPDDRFIIVFSDGGGYQAGSQMLIMKTEMFKE